MDFRRLTRQFILNEAQGPSVSSYLQSISEVLTNIRPSTRTDERRIEMARQSLKEVRRQMRRLQERVGVLEEQVSILEENKE
jgi:polyhydroxyalkanoate synthesis regulator phasin